MLGLGWTEDPNCAMLNAQVVLFLVNRFCVDDHTRPVCSEPNREVVLMDSHTPGIPPNFCFVCVESRSRYPVLPRSRGSGLQSVDTVRRGPRSCLSDMVRVSFGPHDR